MSHSIGAVAGPASRGHLLPASSAAAPGRATTTTTTTPTSTTTTTTTPLASTRLRRIPLLAIWMVMAIVVVAGLGYWDQQREARAALDDFADDQAWLAQALSRALVERLAVVERDAVRGAEGASVGEHRLGDLIVMVSNDGAAHARRTLGQSPASASSANRVAAATDPMFHFDVPLPASDPKRAEAMVPMAWLLSSVRSFERPGDVRVLIQPPGALSNANAGAALLDAKSTASVRAPAISAALGQKGLRSLRLTPKEAAAIYLPERLAMAGLAHVDAGPALGTWHVVVVATAQSERDREQRARVRLLLGVTVVAGLVIAFGGAALRRRTKELELLHALEIGDVQRERDEQLVRAEKFATMGALAMGVAHEVSTPLGVILARAEQIVSRPDDAERARRGSAMIVSEAERINEVIRGFIGLARGNAPRLEDALPATLARNAMSLVSHRFAKAGVQLVAQLDPTTPAVPCDPRLLEQVLVNLLLNACDACDDGDTRNGLVELVVRGDGQRVAFVVTDNGVGIREEDVTRATEPFFTTKPEGTGLGLAISNEIIKHHRGSLVLRPRSSSGSALGGYDHAPLYSRGTQVVVELPVSPPSHPNLSESAAADGRI